MRLSKMMDGLHVIKLFQTVYGSMVQTHDVEINNIRYDSREVRDGDMFVAIKGFQSDGHKFLQRAVENRAKALVVEDDASIPDSLCMHEGVVKIVVPDTRSALSRISANFFGHPSKSLHITGVTGTNGKTTTAYLIDSITRAADIKGGLIGTIEYRIGEKSAEAGHTTPESYELQSILRKMADEGCSHVVMEVSSHALEQRRVDNVNFSAAIFTNLTQDHLDYHVSMESYFTAKKKLFDMLGDGAIAITNADSDYGLKVVEDTRASVITYGTAGEADITARNINATLRGTSFTISHAGEEIPVESDITGRFNVSNILAAYASAYAAGFDKSAVQKGIKDLKVVRGRFDTVESPLEEKWIAVIDYSHTPDALENVLRSVSEIKPQNGKIITVFGCGGDRDRSKRPLMGAIAQRYSDRIIVTSDNPRTENPEAIIDGIMEGIDLENDVLRESDRYKAIVKGLEQAESGDIIVIAGKGHETYQIIGNERIHFNDREVVEEWIAANKKNDN